MNSYRITILTNYKKGTLNSLMLKTLSCYSLRPGETKQALLWLNDMPKKNKINKHIYSLKQTNKINIRTLTLSKKSTGAAMDLVICRYSYQLNGVLLPNDSQ